MSETLIPSREELLKEAAGWLGLPEGENTTSEQALARATLALACIQLAEAQQNNSSLLLSPVERRAFEQTLEFIEDRKPLLYADMNHLFARLLRGGSHER